MGTERQMTGLQFRGPDLMMRPPYPENPSRSRALCHTVAEFVLRISQAPGNRQVLSELTRNSTLELETD